eukprot:TRINITY_DN7097_c0_g1_i2.p1 TRINITY_DN7097_c0_g1~~TRINITY_DN7097_c0_g1_i2.p1  ORF type:complete len:114 (+),score=13.35 TRINITY_DN7097_c0_g1_i2:26-367(+)
MEWWQGTIVRIFMSLVGLLDRGFSACSPTKLLSFAPLFLPFACCNLTPCLWSRFRFHEQDPLPFSNGFRLQWRNGDMDNPVTGNKCFTQSGGRVVGHPTVSQVTTYAWVYVWD